MKLVAGLAMLAVASSAGAQRYDSEGQLWKAMTGGVSARCMIEVATVTNEQHLLTQDAYRTATEQKAIRLAGEARRLLRPLDTALSAHRRELERQRDFLDNGLITRAEYDAIAARAPNLQPIVDLIQAYPACDFFNSTYGDAIRQAREIARGRR